MTFSAADIISALVAFGAILTAIFNGRKTHAEVQHAEASAVNQYAEAASRMAAAAADCQDKIVKMGERVDAMAATLESRDKQIAFLEQEIRGLETAIRDMTEQMQKKDTRIAELERLTQSQEHEIITLRAEVEALRLKRR